MILTRVSVVLRKKALYLSKRHKNTEISLKRYQMHSTKRKSQDQRRKRYKTSPEMKEPSPSFLCHFLCVSGSVCLFHHQKERVWCNLLEAWFVPEKRKLLPESCKEKNERQRIKSKKGRRSSKWFRPSRSFSRHSSRVAEKRGRGWNVWNEFRRESKEYPSNKSISAQNWLFFSPPLESERNSEKKRVDEEKRDTRREEMRMLFAPFLLLLQLNSIRILLFFDPFFSSPLIFFPISFTSRWRKHMTRVEQQDIL